MKNKMKDIHFVDDFWCGRCGSTTAIRIENLKIIRCMGCDQFFKISEPFTAVVSPIKLAESGDKR